MNKYKVVSCAVLLLALSACGSHRSGNASRWRWPNYEGQPSHVGSGSNHAGHYSPREPSLAHEPKIYGAPKSDWNSMSASQQAYVKAKYEAKHPQQDNEDGSEN